ncbi:MAG: chemotaxis response regulator protein-glutamate methylesterase [Zoogloeaceae bacterium]|jgi:two-component system chemotaxis response regulator CheB|nr:chemotaxis response regulator protein-glutamate methylesterase [Zoogloeaceae bacterium]
MSIRVLVVDDSSFMRKQLSKIINAAPDLEVVGAAEDARSARDMLQGLKPDVITLDVQMPDMNGLEFLERLMRKKPVPVVMVSAFTQEGSETTLKALELGAVDFIAKPRADNLKAYGLELAEKIRAAKSAHLRVNVRPTGAAAKSAGVTGTPVPQAAPRVAPRSGMAPSGGTPVHFAVGAGGGKVIFLGASTGGTEAIKKVLMGMPANCPPILIVQHMPETFSSVFAASLDRACQPKVREAQGGELVESGNVYVTRGNHHMQVRKEGNRLYTQLVQTPPVNGHRPSVDVLFASAAAVMGKQAVGVILTGMGRDGAQGLLSMRKAGARTFGQDEASCVVYGMPREAFLIGAVEEVVDIEQITPRVLSLFR